MIKLIAGDLLPNFGSIKVNGSVSICPQDLNAMNYGSVADVFGVTAKLDALENIIAGSINEEDFAVLRDDWGVQERLQKQLKESGLEKLDLRRKLSSLSGGEITRLWLAKIFASDTDFLILDEPTNNLDIVSRHLLYDKIEDCKKNLILISHDRKLLELMQQIIEIGSIGVKTYGGNYSYYLEQKNIEREAKERQLADAKKTVQKTKQSIQLTQEKRAKRESQGVRLRKSGSQAPIILDGFKESATKAQGGLALREERMLAKAQKVFDEARAGLENSEEFKFVLPETKIPSGKVVVCLEQVGFTYPNSKEPVVNNVNLTVVGPDRIAIMGGNGSGKTTLVKLIMGELVPTIGKITRGVENVRYLDQYASLLDPDASIVDNFKILNPDLKETEARFCLARFLFRDRDALKTVKVLSSGEKMRVMLACVLMSKNPPQLLILDEPTNHLDLASIFAIESALNCYKGALIVISHDETFINNIAVNKSISMAS